jgi:diguanylate cyclase (GGDEF)-like protein
MLDLDYFKKINDQYGHAIGDQVLKQVGKLVQTVCCENQICGRFGGEEFIVGFPNTPLKKAKEKLEELRTKTLKISDNFPTIELKISLSIGLCANNQHSDIDSMIKCADEALYVAKNQGRNQLVVG